MQPATSDYASAIVAGYRRILPQAIIDIIDPNITYGSVSVSGQSRYSKPDQLRDKNFTAPEKLATLEKGRWLLDGSWGLFPDNPQALSGQIGYLGDVLSGADGTFTAPPFVQLNMQNLSILQACSVHFTGLSCDGVGNNFTVTVLSGADISYQKEIFGNLEKDVYLDGFTATNVTAIRVSFSKWSLPNRFVRLMEIVPGIYETWDEDTIYSIDVLQETSLSCMATPYGICTLQVYNKNKRFNPYNRSGLFRSVQEGQGVCVAMATETERGPEYLPLGVYYQKSGGWETDAYGLTVTFKLVDIIGLFADRKFAIPQILPTTLGGWLSAITAQLGPKFQTRWDASPELAATTLTADAESLKSCNCGALLRYLCMASCSCFRARAADGKLLVFRPTQTFGVKMDEDNMPSYPKNTPTDTIASITFRLADAAKTEYVFAGTVGADKTLSVNNPFIHTQAQADATAAFILSFYNTTQFTALSRGDMRSELSDLDTVPTGFGTSVIGRRFKQEFKIANGIMKDAPSYLLEVTGA